MDRENDPALEDEEPEEQEPACPDDKIRQFYPVRLADQESQEAGDVPAV